MASSTLAAFAIAGALGYKARQGAQQGPTIPAPPSIPDQPVSPDPTRAYTDALARQKRRSTVGMMGRTSTLLTGPQGVTSSVPAQRKNLLGS
ncbi:MAG: hypothetical protein M3O61_03625 [Gemmatimonadota bacterium]|nr:hypothetical protein [Gemmatimonadota bacterium]